MEKIKERKRPLPPVELEQDPGYAEGLIFHIPPPLLRDAPTPSRIRDISSATLDEVLEEAKKPEGFWFRTNDGDVFVLFVGVRERHPDDPDIVKSVMVTVNLFYDPVRSVPLPFLEERPREGLWAVGYFDREFLYMEDGSVRAFTSSCLTDVGRSRPLKFMSRLREKVGEALEQGTKISFYIHPLFSHYRKAEFSGLSRLLISVQDHYSKKLGIRKVHLEAPTTDLEEIYRHFYIPLEGKVKKVEDVLHMDVLLPSEINIPKIRRIQRSIYDKSFYVR